MARRARRLRLTPPERQELSSRQAAQALSHRAVLRARIILGAAEGVGHRAIGRLLGLSVQTVRKWRRRFERERVPGLEDRPRRGRPRKLKPAEQGRLLALACEPPALHGHPERTHWELDLLVAEAIREGIVPAVGRSTVARLLEAGALHPHRLHYWLHSRDPEFDRKQREIVRLYLRRGIEEVVLCVDEKSQMQALERLAPYEPARPGRPGRLEFEYRRHGVVTLLGAFEVHTGRVFGRCYGGYSLRRFLGFLEQVAARYPERRVRIVLDNLPLHRHPAVEERLRRWKGRLSLHFTPLHASWLNQIEIWFSILHRRLLRRGSFRDRADLARQILRFIGAWNRRAHPFRWTYTGDLLAA